MVDPDHQIARAGFDQSDTREPQSAGLRQKDGLGLHAGTPGRRPVIRASRHVIVSF